MKKKLIIGLSTGLVIVAAVAVVIIFVVLKPFENKHTHDYTSEVTTAATCTADGVTTYTCSCGDSYTEAIPAKGHTPAEAVKENEIKATCTEDGSYDNVVYCSVCSAEISRETRTEKATGHTKVIDEAVAPTCTKTGKTEGSHCSVCNAVMKAQEVIPAAGHTFGAWTETRTDCAQEGERTRTCSVCGYEETEQLSAGMHSWDDGEITQAATCTETGVETFTCLLCGETKTETISAKGHTPAEAVKENEKAASCTTDGSYDSVIYCTVCGAEISRKTKTIEATGHSWNNGEITTEATCTEAGVMAYTCTVCGAIRTETLPAADHTPISADNAVAPTCTAAGKESDTVCSVCGETLSTGAAISALGHNYVDGVCTVCGEREKTSSEGLKYTLSDDGTFYIVSGIGTCKDTDIVIPATYKGLPVTSIGRYAFWNCTGLRSVTIGSGVTSIGAYAFDGCTSLMSITIPDSVTYIGISAFWDCTALTEINYNATECADLGYNNSAFYNAGKNGNGITVTIGSNVKKIPAYLFYPYSNSSSYSPKIVSVVFAENSQCTSIGSYAFYECTSLTSINIPDNVTSIGEYAFYDCTSLTSINIPDGVTSIGEYAFYYCTSLESVTIGNNVTSIGNYAFMGCSSLKSVNHKNRQRINLTKAAIQCEV